MTRTTAGTMEALVLTAPGEVQNRRVPVPPAPGPADVLIRVTRAGICGSELEAIATKSPRRVPPLIMGHEFAGQLEAVGAEAAAAGWRPGDRVVPNPLVSCGRCPACEGAGRIKLDRWNGELRVSLQIDDAARIDHVQA